MPIIPATARLRYEPLTVAHADEVFKALSDKRLYTYIPSDPFDSIDGLRARYERLCVGHSPDGTQIWLNWIMREFATDAPVGYLQATVTPDHSATIAYFVFTAHQRKHYAREGVMWMLACLTSQYGVTVAKADVDTRNEASNRLLQGLGFFRSAVTRDADYFKGATSDEFHYKKSLI